MLPHEFQEYIVKVIFVIFATCLMCMRMSRAAEFSSKLRLRASVNYTRSNSSTFYKK